MENTTQTETQPHNEIIQLCRQVTEFKPLKKGFTSSSDEIARLVSTNPLNKQLTTLELHIIEAEEAERRRLARELHDQVGQSLTAMGLNLDIIQTLLPKETPVEIVSRLKDLRQLIIRTTKCVREVMLDLRPEMLDDYGLLAALRWSTERFTQRTGIAVKVDSKGTENRLPEQVENVLYRVAQELLTNVAKHAQATQVTVYLSVNEEKVHMIVTDNGIGFIYGQHTSHNSDRKWGLEIMTERIESINGRFHINTTPGKGTHVFVEVPQ